MANRSSLNSKMNSKLKWPDIALAICLTLAMGFMAVIIVRWIVG